MMDLNRLDLDGRDLLWLAVLDCVASGPVELGRVVVRVERVCDDDDLTRRLAGFLQEMARGQHIRLENDGRRWIVALGRNGAATLARLAGRPRHPFTLGLACLRPVAA
jgi:hypothetical protein